MPVDPSIYNILNPQGLQSGLMSIGEAYGRGREESARLAQLAQQKELQDIQLAQAKRQEALVPQQQAEAQRQLEDKHIREMSFGVAQALNAGYDKQHLVNETYQEAKRRGISDEGILKIFSPLSQGVEDKALSEYYMGQAAPEETQKAMIKAKYEQQKGTELSKLIAERDRRAQINPDDPALKIYDQAIEKQSTFAPVPPAVMLATGEGGVQSIVTVDKGKTGKVSVTPTDIKKPTKEAQLSPQAQKELFEADENVQTASSVMSTLNQALDLNKKSYSGYGALLRAKAASNLPGQTDPKADNTILMDNLIREQALSSLRMVFGGNPTEGERSVLLELQASSEKTPEQRASILNRAMKLAENKMKFNQKKAESLRGGTYFKEAPTIDISAQPVQKTASENQVTLPNGTIKTFPSAAAAQAFKKAAGL